MGEETVLLTPYTIAQMDIEKLSEIRERLEKECTSKSGHANEVLTKMINAINKEIILKRKIRKIDDKYEWWQAHMLNKKDKPIRFPMYERDIKRQLLKHLNYRNHKRYDIKKRKVHDRLYAIVYYKYKEKTYQLGYFILADPTKIESGFVRHKYDYLDNLTSMQIKSAQNRFIKQLKALQIMQDSGLL